MKSNNFKGNWTGTNTQADFQSANAADAPPKFYREEEVTFKNGDVTLSGTLLLPNENGTIFRLSLLTHGSGPATRATYKSWGLKFVEKGIAALDL